MTREEAIEVYNGLIMYVKDWLKSLRPSWKPSKEQIYSLGTVVNGMGENASGVSKNLCDLYEQLKKL
jgi:hypothetical protein